MAMLLRVRAMTQRLMMLLWFLLHFHSAAAVALPSLVSAESVQRLSCPNKCGDVVIPYPFGIGDECAKSGFTVSCNDSFSPSKPYIGNIEIIDISLEKGEIRMYTFAAYLCYNSINTTFDDSRTSAGVNFSGDSPFLVAQTSNEFTAIGCETVALLQGRDDGSFLTGCITTCSSLETAAKDGETCAGLGCCQLPSIPANLTSIDVGWGDVSNNSAWSYSPCKYAFVAEKGWYNFSRQDFSRNGSKSFVYSDGAKNVRTVVDWAVRKNGTCPSANSQKAPACMSNNSYCINVTNGEGYLCNCSAGYDGNPYLTGDDGCTNINECDPSIYKEQYPCSGGTCHDLQGSFECKCNFGERQDSKNDKVCRPVLSKLAIVVIAITCAIAILSVLLILLFMAYEKKRLRGIFNKNGGQLLKNKGIELFTEQEIRKITHNYGTIIGKGGFGEVYKGKVNNNQQVAVKRSIMVDNNQQVAAVKRIQRSITIDEACRKDMANEISVQSEISHKNVVKLVGCCLETNIPMLVFEYIPKGSLHDVLHGNGDGNNNVAKHNLTLDERLAIAIGSADALDYMHSSLSRKILHGDVKSNNILLDEYLVPKVSDFGISRLMTTEKDHTNWVIGDRSYMDPVYMRTGILTEKSDVYSFGVVLLELITRKKPKYDGNNILQINFVKSYMSDSRARGMFDDELASPEANDCLDMIGRIAVQSLKEDVEERPTMKQVLEELHSVRKEWMQTLGHMV